LLHGHALQALAHDAHAAAVEVQVNGVALLHAWQQAQQVMRLG
jgi:hypothetical protein